MKTMLRICMVFHVCIIASVSISFGENVLTTWPAHYVQDVVFQGDSIWCATNHGVLKWNRSSRSYTEFTQKDCLSSDIVYSVAMGANGILWFGTMAGLTAFDGIKWTTYTALSNGFPSDRIKACRMDGNGMLWCGTDNGVFSFDGKTCVAYHAKDGLVSEQVKCLAVDRNNIVWCGTSAGVSSFDGSEWKKYTTSNGLQTMW